MATRLRDRMKLETNRAITRAAQDLVHARGLAGVTVEQIATEAGVSMRTFFNYFSCKEAAVVGIPQELLEELSERLTARPASEGPQEALRAVLLEHVADGSIQRRWQLRSELVQREPGLLPQYLSALLKLEDSLIGPLSERMGVDPKRDPGPVMLLASVFGALRAGAAWWEHSDRTAPIESVLDRAFSICDPLTR